MFQGSSQEVGDYLVRAQKMIWLLKGRWFFDRARNTGFLLPRTWTFPQERSLNSDPLAGLLPWKVLGAQEAGKGNFHSGYILLILGKKKLDILEPESDPYFQAFLAPNNEFLVGTQLYAPGTQEKASTGESLGTF